MWYNERRRLFESLDVRGVKTRRGEATTSRPVKTAPKPGMPEKDISFIHGRRNVRFNLVYGNDDNKKPPPKRAKSRAKKSRQPDPLGRGLAGGVPGQYNPVGNKRYVTFQCMDF